MMTEKALACLSANTCPDCGKTNHFVRGPRGGLGQNIACTHCGNEFNVIHARLEHGTPRGPVIIAYRNNAKGGPNRKRLLSVFGIDLLEPTPEQEIQERAARKYFDMSFPDRKCEHCHEVFRGPAVYCSLECTLAEA